MEFYRLGEIPVRSEEQVFKASPVAIGVWFIVFSGIGIALLLLAMSGAKIHGLNLPPVVFIYFGAATFGLIAWFVFEGLRASLRPTNWLLRCHSGGVIIKYRSILNWRFPAEDVQAVGFDYSEIAWVRTAKERRASPGIGGKPQSQEFTYLDFWLANADTSDLEARLQAEQKAEPPGIWITLDYPVEVLPGGIVQLRWNGIRPSSRKAIEYLSQHVKIAAADSSKIDLTHQSNAGPGEEDAKILNLAKSGDKMGAVKLTRQIYGSTLTEAVEFVEKLQSNH